MKRIRVRLVAVVAVIVSGLAPAVIAPTPAPALSNPNIPWLTLNRTITSQPWGGSTTKAFDLEGSAYLQFDHTLWVVDDQGDDAPSPRRGPLSGQQRECQRIATA